MSVNCFTTVIYIVIVGVLMCCECCFTTVIYNVMTIALSFLLHVHMEHTIHRCSSWARKQLKEFILCFDI
jgi:hypothetical protein